MKSGLTVSARVRFEPRRKGTRCLVPARETNAPVAPTGRLPRITRLMALAIHFDGLIQSGVVANYAELARLGNVTRARMTQIMNLLNLAPSIQEELLFLPRVEGGRAQVCLREMQAIAMTTAWSDQRNPRTLDTKGAHAQSGEGTHPFTRTNSRGTD
jgi:hypothetical protein